MTTFNYLKHTEYQDTIDIEEVGDVVLDLYNDDGSEWYLSTMTACGYTKIITCGPFTADSNEIGLYFNFNYQQTEYNEKRLYQLIDKFINDDHKNITQIFFIDHDTLTERLSTIKEFQINYG